MLVAPRRLAVRIDEAADLTVLAQPKVHVARCWSPPPRRPGSPGVALPDSHRRNAQEPCQKRASPWGAAAVRRGGRLVWGRRSWACCHRACLIPDRGDVLRRMGEEASPSTVSI